MQHLLVNWVIETDYGQMDLVWSEYGGSMATRTASSPVRPTDWSALSKWTEWDAPRSGD
jgi:hypothetical protein